MSAKPTKPTLDSKITEALVNLGIYQTMKIPDTAHAMREMLRPAIKALIAEEVEAVIDTSFKEEPVWDGDLSYQAGRIDQIIHQGIVAQERLGIKENER